MTHIDKNSIKHFSVCFLLSLIGAYGMCIAIGASVTNWYIAGSGIVASTYWKAMISLTDVATNVITEGFTQRAYNQLKNYSYSIGANTYSSGQLVVVGLYDSSFINEGALTQDFYDYISNKDIQFILASPTTELVDAPQIEEAESYSCEISQGAKAVSRSSFETGSE